MPAQVNADRDTVPRPENAPLPVKSALSGAHHKDQPKPGKNRWYAA